MPVINKSGKSKTLFFSLEEYLPRIKDENTTWYRYGDYDTYCDFIIYGDCFVEIQMPQPLNYIDVKVSLGE
jgi:hypothetical protein